MPAEAAGWTAEQIRIKEKEVQEVNMMRETVQSVNINGRMMRYLRFGKEDGTTVVIIPGVSLKSVMGAAKAIMKQYALLGEDYDVILFDRISVYPEPYDEAMMAKDILKAMEQLGIERASVMGVSQGGMIAQIMAGTRPEMVHCLLLCSTAANMKYADLKGIEQWRQAAEDGDVNRLMELFGSMVYTPEFYAQYKEVIIASGEGATAQELKNLAITLKTLPAFDYTDHLDEIRCPVYVIGAGEDRVLGVQASKELIERDRFDGYIYEGKGHGVYDEAPDYVERVKAFFDQNR